MKDSTKDFVIFFLRFLRIPFSVFCIFQGYFELFPEIVPEKLAVFVLPSTDSTALNSTFSVIYLVTGASVISGVYANKTITLAVFALGMNIMVLASEPSNYIGTGVRNITDAIASDDRTLSDK